MEFYCVDCDFIAASNKTLKQHYLTNKHLKATGKLKDKKFACMHCDACYCTNSNLTRHLKICKQRPIENAPEEEHDTNQINDIKYLTIAINKLTNAVNKKLK